MALDQRIVITGAGAISAAGDTLDATWESVRDGRSAIAPVRPWQAAGWSHPMAAEVAADDRALVADGKVRKVIGRSDCLGLHAAEQALVRSGLIERLAALSADEAAARRERVGVFVGNGGGSYRHADAFLPALASASDAAAFGAEALANVPPLWLLTTLPNNVVCHIGIRYGFKGPNACITNHGTSGLVALAEATAALRAGEADAAIVVAHDAPVEPQTQLYYASLGLLSPEVLRPFDAASTGTVLGEGAGALVLEPATAARAAGRPILGEVVSISCVAEGEGLLPVRADGDGLARAVADTLQRGQVAPGEVGMVVAHGNGTAQSDASEAAALHRVFGAHVPPVTGFKWAIGHTLAAAGVLETALAAMALRSDTVPGIATLRVARRDVPVSPRAQVPRAPIALVLSRGFAGIDAALLLRGGTLP